jgi:predicted small lipoprotein YifL
MKRIIALFLILTSITACGVRGNPEAPPAFTEQAS